MLLTITTSHRPASDLVTSCTSTPTAVRVSIWASVTPPNREFNVKWETVGADRFRHPDQRFEWTRQEFQEWANGIRFLAVGPQDEKLGSPTQIGTFESVK